MTGNSKKVFKSYAGTNLISGFFIYVKNLLRIFESWFGLRQNNWHFCVTVEDT